VNYKIDSNFSPQHSNLKLKLDNRKKQKKTRRSRKKLKQAKGCR